MLQKKLYFILKEILFIFKKMCHLTFLSMAKLKLPTFLFKVFSINFRISKRTRILKFAH